MPLVTWLLIALNCLVFFIEISSGSALGRLVDTYAFVPARFFGASGPGIDPAARFTPLLTSMFLHAGWVHLAGNMLFLYIFGDNVEDSFGHVRFAIFYLVCGAFSALAQAAAFPSATTPMVGASGAIAGMLGAYFVLFPHARVVALIPLVIAFPIVEIPAFFFLLIWFLLQFWSGAADLTRADAAGGGVAWWAHIGGFALGLAVALAVRTLRAGRRSARSGRGRRTRTARGRRA